MSRKRKVILLRLIIPVLLACAVYYLIPFRHPDDARNWLYVWFISFDTYVLASTFCYHLITKYDPRYSRTYVIVMICFDVLYVWYTYIYVLSFLCSI